MTKNIKKENPKTAVKSAEKVPGGRPFEKGYDPRRNLQGRPEGRKSFSTLFEEAVKKIVKEKKLPIKDPQVDLVVKAIIEGLKGNYHYYKDVMDRIYGRPKQSYEIDTAEESIAKIEELMRALASPGKPKK